MATPGGIPTLSGFSDTISAVCTIVRSFTVDVALLRLRPKALSFYKVKLFNCFTLSDTALAPSRQSIARFRPAYSCLGLMSSAAEGQWSHLQSQGGIGQNSDGTGPKRYRIK